MRFDQPRAFFHIALAHPVQRDHRLLLDRLNRHKAHVRPRHRFTDRLGIVAVILAILPVRGNELGRHELHRMTQTLELARPLVRTGAGFHPDEARR
jgi:hypothetical protein